ncbi:MAG: hypothetical protein IKN17_01220 [Ruminococcus sp.]|nr:hypothetical protein [Ruminococcus sp.]
MKQENTMFEEMKLRDDRSPAVKESNEISNSCLSASVRKRSLNKGIASEKAVIIFCVVAGLLIYAFVAYAAEKRCKYPGCSERVWGSEGYCLYHRLKYESERAFHNTTSKTTAAKPASSKTTYTQPKKKTTTTKKTTSPYDPYDVYDYDDPEDFYLDNFDDFESYEDAEDYYYDYRE